MAENKLGPIVLPWDENRPSELVLFLVAGLVGAIVGATLVHHYRARHTRQAMKGRRR